jgi:hypothetical protein
MWPIRGYVQRWQSTYFDVKEINVAALTLFEWIEVLSNRMETEVWRMHAMMQVMIRLRQRCREGFREGNSNKYEYYRESSKVTITQEDDAMTTTTITAPTNKL